MNSKLKGFPSCWVVNLEESLDRREYMIGEFERLGLKYNICQHKRLEDNQTLRIIGDQEVLDTLPLGATSSHLLTIKQWYETTNEDMVAIFEDDCDFSIVEKWNFTFEEFLSRFGVLWDGLQLCVMHEGFPVMAPRNRLGWDHGLQCYIITRDYARKIVNYYFKNDTTIHFRMPYIKFQMPSKWGYHEQKQYEPTIENVIYGCGTFYIYPIFNHNVHKFKTTVHSDGRRDLQWVAEHSYNYVNQWWDNRGQHATLDQLFDLEWCLPKSSGQTFGMVLPIDI